MCDTIDTKNVHRHYIKNKCVIFVSAAVANPEIWSGGERGLGWGLRNFVASYLKNWRLMREQKGGVVECPNPCLVMSSSEEALDKSTWFLKKKLLFVTKNGEN